MQKDLGQELYILSGKSTNGVAYPPTTYQYDNSWGFSKSSKVGSLKLTQSNFSTSDDVMIFGNGDWYFK